MSEANKPTKSLSENRLAQFDFALFSSVIHLMSVGFWIGSKAPLSKRDELTDLLRRAENGDESTLPALRNIMRDDEFVESLGNLALQVQQTLINAAGGKSLPFKEALSTKMARLRKELAGENPTALERLLAERIALCWLSLHDSEIRFAQMKDLNIKQAASWQERIDRAHKRYLSAIKTLATIRKLALPVLQVNIAERQTNIAGAVPVVAAEKETP